MIEGMAAALPLVESLLAPNLSTPRAATSATLRRPGPASR